MKYFGGLHPQNISRMWFRQIFWGCTAPKYFTEGVPSNIWGVYSPQIFDGTPSVKYLGAVDPPNTDGVPSNIWGLYTPKIFDLTEPHPSNILGCTAPKYFTEGVPSNIWGVYSPQIFHGRGSVKYFGAVHPKIFDLTEPHPSNIWAL